MVDLPTPPLPEATAITDSMPGTARAVPVGEAPGRGAAARCDSRLGCGERALPPVRSAVSATSTEATPGIARTAASALLRTSSQASACVASTVSEKNTLPSVTTMSESLPEAARSTPSGPLIDFSFSRTVLAVTDMDAPAASAQCT